MDRLQKVMAHAGVASRRKSEGIIAEGRVEVNGQTVTEMGTKVDPAQDVIKVDGEVITKEERVYILLYKPVGYITSVEDPRGRKTVLDLIDGVDQRIYPVGRLDYNSSGILLLTNDGELTYILTHTSHMIDKTYLAKVKGELGSEDVEKLKNGVELEDGLTAPAKIKIREKVEYQTEFSLTIHEGRNRQVRRMCDVVGHPVKSLKRISFGPLTLEGLSIGEFRYLSEKEIEILKNLKD